MIFSTSREHPVRVGQRGSGRRPVVEDDRALVHLRKEIGADAGVEDADPPPRRRERRDAARPIRCAVRKAREAAERGGARRPAGAPAPRTVRAQAGGTANAARRYETPSDERHRQRERPEEGADDAGEQGERDEDRRSSRGWSQQGREDLGETGQGRMLREARSSAWRWMFSTTTIASSTTRPSAAAIPPSVIRLIVCPVAASPSSTSATETGIVATATSVGRSRRRKRRSDEGGQNDADDDRVADAVDRVARRTRPGRRTWSSGRPCGRRSGRPARSASIRPAIAIVLADGCWIDVDEHGGASVRRRPDVRHGVADRDRPELAEARPGRRPSRTESEIVGQSSSTPVGAPVHEREVELVVRLDEPGREDHVVLPDRLDDVAGGESSVRRGPPDRAGPGTPASVPPWICTCETPGIRISSGFSVYSASSQRSACGPRVGGERVAEDGEDRRVHPLDVDPGVGREVGADPGSISAWTRWSATCMSVPQENSALISDEPRDVVDSDAPDPGNAEDRLLERARHGRHHPRRGLLAGVGDDLDDREGDGREDRRGKARRGPDSGCAEDDDEKEQSGRPTGGRHRLHRRPVRGRHLIAAASPGWHRGPASTGRDPNGRPVKRV